MQRRWAGAGAGTAAAGLRVRPVLLGTIAWFLHCPPWGTPTHSDTLQHPHPLLTQSAARVAATVLTRAAVDRGSRDNVTVVIVDLSPMTQEEMETEARLTEVR